MGRKFKLSAKGGIRPGTTKQGTGDKTLAAKRDENAAERKRLVEAAESVDAHAKSGVGDEPTVPIMNKRGAAADPSPPPPRKRARTSSRAPAAAGAKRKVAPAPAAAGKRKAAAPASAGPSRLSHRYTTAQNRYHPYLKGGAKGERKPRAAARAQQRAQQEYVDVFNRQVQRGGTEQAQSALAGAIRSTDLRPHAGSVGMQLSEQASMDTHIVDNLAATVAGLSRGRGSKRLVDEAALDCVVTAAVSIQSPSKRRKRSTTPVLPPPPPSARRGAHCSRR